MGNASDAPNAEHGAGRSAALGAELRRARGAGTLCGTELG